MREVKIFYDVGLSREVFETIDLGVVNAGEKTLKSLFFFNNTKFKISIDLKIDNSSILIVQDVKKILSKSVSELVLEFNPKVTLTKPIKADFNIKISYVIT